MGGGLAHLRLALWCDSAQMRGGAWWALRSRCLQPPAHRTPAAARSIDPPGCTDVDDALSVRWLEPGGGGPRLAEVGVHIADVSFFVRQVNNRRGGWGWVGAYTKKVEE